MYTFKKYKKLLKFTCLATLTSSAGWMYYQVNATKEILSNALDTTILNIEQPTVVKRRENRDFVIINVPSDYNGQNPSIANTWNSIMFSFAKRLLILANSDNKYIRKRAVRQLARIKSLYNWQYTQLSSLIDARTAVGLARTPEADPRLFPKPPTAQYIAHTHAMVVDVMKDLLVNLNAISQHPCMGYFISKAFADFHEMEKYADDYSSFELKKYIQSTDEMLPMCLESLLHHASVGNYAKDIAALNGLPLLMEVYNRFKDNAAVTATICRIISYLSMHSELLDTLYLSGWITILAEWVNHDDARISIPAAKALANLDSDEDPVYLQRLYPLHPSSRSTNDNGVDVVFVHGLLGGVFFTWRQRKKDQNPLGVFGKKVSQESITQSEVCVNTTTKKKKLKSSDPELQQIINDLEELTYEGSCDDYEIIWEDIPTKTNDVASGPFCTTVRKYNRERSEDCFTNCWPRDWLAQDCDHLRIIGVNYETNLSFWTPMCPVEKVKTLEERSEELMEQLVKVQIGSRPIVWVTHSMGGLIVKCLLNKASESHNPEFNNIYANTKGIVFYSTPHIGSRVAKFNQASAFLIWPSVEVKELEKHSPKLLEIHEKFLELLKKQPMQIVSFVETQPTLVSAMKFKFMLVETDSGNPGCGEYYEIPLDHLGICKPASRSSFLYQKVLHMIQDIVDNEINHLSL